MATRNNDIGVWRDGWGPKPVKVKDRSQPSERHNQNRWYRVTCWSCPTRPSFLVYGEAGTVRTDYTCTRCGLLMSIAMCAKREAAEAVPVKRRRTQAELED
jgi:hypothetical protein